MNDGDTLVAQARGSDASYTLTIPEPQLWSPTDSYVYDITVSLLNADGQVVDTVASYTGIRSVGKRCDSDGHLRFTLNGEFIFHWGPFNEAWGQHRTLEVGKWAMERDSTRLINIASGGNFWPVDDIVDAHQYPHPDFSFDDDRDRDFIKVVGEFGGHRYPVHEHLWDANRRNWGYGGLPKDEAEYMARYEESIKRLGELKSQGIAAGVYTQTTDVEGEINGLITYDRKAIKILVKQLKEIQRAAQLVD